jgi:DNA-directed RNA polymerase specialized sigma24 family protein
MANIDEIAKALNEGTGNRRQLEAEFLTQAERLLRTEARRIAGPVVNPCADTEDLVQVGLARAYQLLRAGKLGVGHTAHAIIRNGARDMARAAANSQGLSEDEHRLGRAITVLGDRASHLDDETLADELSAALGHEVTVAMAATARTALAARRACSIETRTPDEPDAVVVHLGTEDAGYAAAEVEAPADVVVRLVPRLAAASGRTAGARRSCRAVVGALALDPTVEGLHGAVRSLRSIACGGDRDEIVSVISSVGSVGEDEMSGAPAERLMRALLGLSERPQVAVEALRAVASVLAAKPGCAGLRAAARPLAAAMATVPAAKVRDARAAIRRYVEAIAAQAAEVEAYEALGVAPLALVPAASVSEKVVRVEPEVVTVAFGRRGRQLGLVSGHATVQEMLDLFGEDDHEAEDDLPATIQERLDLFGGAKGEIIAIAGQGSRRARAA